METINIVFTSDNNYAQHLAVTLTSLLENNKEEKFQIYIFENDISNENKKNFKTIINKFNCEIQYINFDTTIFDHIDTGRFTIAAYFRLLMAKYINEDKVLYLDVDMVIANSINQLYNIELNDYYVAAVEDAWKTQEYLDKLGMSENTKYFNAGVLLVNLKKWRDENLLNKFLEYEKNSAFYLESHDQDILNATFNGKWKRLALKYNQYEKNPDLDYKVLKNFFTDEEILEAQRDPVIIHYIGGRKPWHYRNEHVKKEQYWKYLMLTPYKNYIPSDKTLRNIISKNTPQIIRNPKRYIKSLFYKRKN